jgi:hypothetical protein
MSHPHAEMSDGHLWSDEWEDDCNIACRDLRAVVAEVA